VLQKGAAVVADPPRDPARAFDALIGLYYDHSLTYLTKDLWRTAMALAIEAPATPFSRRYAALDHSLTRQVTALVAGLQALELARRDVSAEVVGAILFNTLNQLFIAFVTDESMTTATLKARMATQSVTLARLLAPVGAPSGA
jgi:hypothetical protein